MRRAALLSWFALSPLAAACGNFTLAEGAADPEPVEDASVDATPPTDESPRGDAEPREAGEPDAGPRLACAQVTLAVACNEDVSCGVSDGCCVAAPAGVMLTPADGGGLLLTTGDPGRVGGYFLLDDSLLQGEFRLVYELEVVGQEAPVADGFAFSFLRAQNAEHLPRVLDQTGGKLGVQTIRGFCGASAYLSTFTYNAERGHLDWGTWTIPGGGRDAALDDPPRFLNREGVRVRVEFEHWLEDDDDQLLSCPVPGANADAGDAESYALPTVVLRARALRCDDAGCTTEFARSLLHVPRDAHVVGVTAATGQLHSEQILRHVELCR